MLTPSTFNALLRNNKILILDGASASELEVRGHNLNHPLWSGLILRDSPPEITRLHREYFLSGANIAITASYQTSTKGLIEHFNFSELEAKRLIGQSVRLAQVARDEAQLQMRDLLVAGSVGPHGAYLANGAEYTGFYGSEITQSDLRDFHRPRIEALVAAGADLLAVETLPHFGELKAILDLLSNDFPQAIAWMSFTLKDSKHIPDGTALEDVLRSVVKHNNDQIRRGHAAQIVAFGFNCVQPQLALEACEFVAELQARESELAITLVCYPNSGESWDGEKKVWLDGEKGDVKETGELARRLRDAGVRLIGGCCRTGLKYIGEVAAAVG